MGELGFNIRSFVGVFVCCVEGVVYLFVVCVCAGNCYLLQGRSDKECGLGCAAEDCTAATKDKRKRRESEDKAGQGAEYSQKKLRKERKGKRREV